MRQHEANVIVVAHFFKGHAAVSRVYYPGLPDHPGHAIAVKQMKGFGSMVSFEMKDGREAVNRFLRGIKLFTLAESLGA
jgi:cystathionine gamma-synthase